MRAAHSLKGAARIVDIDAGVALAHAMEDFLVAAQEGRIALDQGQHRSAAARRRSDDGHRAQRRTRARATGREQQARRRRLRRQSGGAFSHGQDNDASRTATPRRLPSTEAPCRCMPAEQPPKPAAAATGRRRVERSRAKSPTGSCASPSTTSTACSAWPASRSSNRAGSSRSAVAPAIEAAATTNRAKAIDDLREALPSRRSTSGRRPP